MLASTGNRILFGLSGVVALASAILIGLILLADAPVKLPEAAMQAPAAKAPHDEPPKGEAPEGAAEPARSDSAIEGAEQRSGDAAHGASPPTDHEMPAKADAMQDQTAHGAADTGTASPPASEMPEPQQQAARPLPPPPSPPPAVLPPLGRDSVGALAPAPDPGLVEQVPDGLLPKVGADGRQPWQVYARPFNANEPRPRVVIVLTALGLSSAATESAIQGLPGAVTLAFHPYADNLQQWIHLARAAGHEVLINLPLEPLNYPTRDPGPQALFTAFEPSENLERLNWTLSRVTGYVGVSTHMGSRFTTSREAMAPILQVIGERGLLFLDTRASARSVATTMATERGVPRVINDRFLDAREVSRATIDARLSEVEKIAREAGVSIAVGQAYPVTIERIRAWVQTLDTKGLVLAPVSAAVNLQADR